ncbi:hypothetical protein [Actinokineospora spheciospongiae]|uniref:hypothetical protein n=1 Tax=Actinokineospora spheciospongiae TaxID=909613 RepID=UPI000D8E676B|nr:hypothetical protein [Actinokineospora spheciospongiae]PWW63255.1 hypothetical protein DFQ13_104245 [Actinokineospora spheciospongiae]
MKRSRWAVASAAAVVVVGGVLVPAAMGKTSADGDRVETPVVSSSPVPGVVESVVKVRVPLPAEVGPHPEACDWVSYLRWRSAAGPADSAAADRVLIAQPGIFEGAGAFDSLARNTITQAAGQGAHVEFWALDRRSNCLEDNTGRMAGLAARDVHVAVDYYYRDKQVDGKTFAGFQTNDQVGWLGHVGMAQTLRDQYDLMRHELPDPAVRKQKLFCGGHSLGGIITGYFATWDFDGDPATTDDAGFNQCAGWFALDSQVRPGLPGGGMTSLIPSGDPATSPILALPALINPETMSMLGLAGLAAVNDPTGKSDLLKYLPQSDNIKTTLKILFAKDLVNLLTGIPVVDNFAFTNQTAMAALMDNNSMPLGFLQAGVGFFDGGRIADKEFPIAGEVADLPFLADLKGLLGPDRKAIPTDAGFPLGTGPTYTWRNYDQIDAPGAPVHKSRDGKPFTTAAQEVTDVQQLARSLGEAPLDFTEWYFPAKLSGDSGKPDAEMTAHSLHPGGINARPILTVRAGSGVNFGAMDPSQPPAVVAPGYHHLDVLTAAARQNGGRQEVVSVNLAQFVLGN